MINVSVFFNGLNTREEWLSLAQKLYAEKKFVKYIYFEKMNDKKGFNNVCDGIYRLYEYMSDCADILASSLLRIDTKSRKALQLLNEFAKKNNYHYDIWGGSRYSAYRLHMTLDELLNEYPK